MYQILYHPQTVKQLKRLPLQDRYRVIDKIKRLAGNPYTSLLDIKKFSNIKNGYRLRIGNIRIIYEVNQTQ